MADTMILKETLLYKDDEGRIELVDDGWGEGLKVTLLCPCGGEQYKCCHGRGGWSLEVPNWKVMETTSITSRGKPGQMAIYAMKWKRAHDDTFGEDHRPWMVSKYEGGRND